MITEADVQKMQGLYTQRFGIKLERDEAYRKLALLVRQMEIIYQPITAQQLQELTYADNVVNEENEDGKPASSN